MLMEMLICSKPLPITFDFDDQATLRRVGRYAKDFKALLGVTLRQTVPFTYDAWDNVPRDTRTAIYPQLQTYFDIGRYIGPTGISDSFERGINRLCSSLYSTAKYHFKNKHFTKLGGYDNVDNTREIVAPNMDAQAWNDLIEYHIQDDNMHRCENKFGLKRVGICKGWNMSTGPVKLAETFIFHNLPTVKL